MQAITRRGRRIGTIGRCPCLHPTLPPPSPPSPACASASTRCATCRRFCARSGPPVAADLLSLSCDWRVHCCRSRRCMSANDHRRGGPPAGTRLGSKVWPKPGATVAESAADAAGDEFALAIASDLLGRLAVMPRPCSRNCSPTPPAALMENAATLDLEDSRIRTCRTARPRPASKHGADELDGAVFGQAQTRLPWSASPPGYWSSRPGSFVAASLIPASSAKRFQRAQLFAQLPVDARASPARIHASDRRSIETAKGSRSSPAPLLHRALSRASQGCSRLIASWRASVPHGHAAGRARYPRLLHRLSYIAWRTVQGDFTSAISPSRRQLPQPATTAEAAGRFLAGRRASAVSRRSVLVLRYPAGNQIGTGRGGDPRPITQASCSKTSVSLPGAEKWALRGRRLPTPRRRSAGLVGENGAGKTTW